MATRPPENKPACGLCGKKKKLTKTECCDTWICDDYHQYEPNSNARNSCHRNHDRLTLCGAHHHGEHQGSWQDCKKCKDVYNTPHYVWFGTNEYNFEVVKNPEKVSISCVKCGFTANTVDAFPLETPEGFYCAKDRCQRAGRSPTEWDQCGLCGNDKGKLKRTPCCNNWICDDYDNYVMFSYARNSCDRNHGKYTLCALHHGFEHYGRWQDCNDCKEMLDIPHYVWHGTNEYNFEILKNSEKVSISCSNNCGFTADTVEAFPLVTSKGLFQGVSGYYCPKEKCQKAGRAY